MSCNFELGEVLHLTNDGGIYRILEHKYDTRKHSYERDELVNVPNIAVKLIDPNENRNYKREIKITEIAADSGIAPKVFDSCKTKLDGKKMYGLVFEYLDGAMTLDRVLSVGWLNTQIVSDIKQLLDVMYNNGIIHNDLHGENILFDTNRNPYLIDFGMSKLEKRSVPIEERDYIIELSFKGRDKSYPIILNVRRNLN